MVELDNMKNTLSTYEKPLEEIRNSLDLDNKEKRIAELDRMMEEPGFWDNPEESTKIVRENRSLKNTMERFQKLESSFSDIGDMIELGNEEEDEGMIPEIREMLDEFIHELEELKSETLLTGEYDANNAILRLNAGAGGTESSDWCSMLYRMYTRWAERQGYSVEVLDFLDGDVAGIKSVTIQINGENAYGRLRGGQAADLLRFLRRDAGAFQRYPRGDQSGRHPGGHLPLQRRRRTAHQQDQLRYPHHPPAHGHRGHLPERAQPVPEQGQGDADAGGEALYAGAAEAGRRGG